MSTTTVSYRSTTRDANLAAVRRREAEAREAARRARRHAQEERRRAAEERRREEEERRRIARANQAIVDQEVRFQEVVARLDDAARRLPDLTLAAPRLAAMSESTAQNPAKLEAYAAQLTADVDTFARRVDGAIAEAERLLARRIAKAAAWRRAGDLEQQLELLRGEIRDVAAQLGTQTTAVAAPGRPGPEAELELVEGLRSRPDSAVACSETAVRQPARPRLVARERDHPERHPGSHAPRRRGLGPALPGGGRPCSIVVASAPGR
jgi:DNA repair exonuclease SbcCD ATPase subunit